MREFLLLKDFILRVVERGPVERRLDSKTELGANFVSQEPMFVFRRVAKVSSAMEEYIAILPTEEALPQQVAMALSI